MEYTAKDPNMTDDETHLVSEVITQSNAQKTSQEKEILVIINTLRQLSYQQQLSQDGRPLLTKLQRKQWIWSIFNAF
ncbi:MAG TPA: hypothetical protein K8V21_06730 [Weissella thailandensis]|uniref:hypothetical protein n=1 Tax=Weissella thailandensis TaxID=89061 RepID=UPI001D630106|nr:hypothetical protein [Weissella thailandensis]HJG85062.1 hypothetical protein [Weissella thailandensis]